MNTMLGPYQVIKFLGKGWLGSVYLVIRNKKYYAIKKIKIERKIRYHNEITILKHLNKVGYNYVPKYYENFEKDGHGHIVMEHLKGPTLLKFLRTRKINRNIRLNMCKQLKYATIELHKHGVAHLDCAPQNIIVVGNRPNFKIKIIDFEGSIFVQHNYPKLEHYFKIDFFKHIYDYTSPERIQKYKYYDSNSSEIVNILKSADMWTLGLNIYLIFNSCLPWYIGADGLINNRLDNNTLEDMVLNSEIIMHGDTKKIVGSCLNRNYKSRFIEL